MNDNLMKKDLCEALEETIKQDVFRELYDDEKRMFVSEMLKTNLQVYNEKKQRNKDVSFLIIKTIGKVFLSDLKGETKDLFPKVLSVPFYLIQSIKNNVQISRSINIANKNLAEQNLNIIVNQIIESEKYEQDLVKYLKDINMQIKLSHTFIKYESKCDTIKERLNQRKQKMLSLSKKYEKRKS